MPYLLTILILLPFAGALALVLYGFAPQRRDQHYRWIALVTTVATFAVSLLLLRGIGGTGAEFRFEESVNWIGSIGARYHVAVDGVSLWLVLLTTLLMPIAVLSSWTAISKRPLAYFAFLLILESAMIGVFVSLDLLLFYLFFEASLVPMFFLIGIWGGERRIYAAIKFFIYTAVGSLLMLVGIIALYFIYNTFDYPTLLQVMTASPLTPRAEFFLFAAFALAFCIKVPLFPLHTWLPDACRRQIQQLLVQLVGLSVSPGSLEGVHRRTVVLPEGIDELRRAPVLRLKEEGVPLHGDPLLGNSRTAESLDDMALHSPRHRADEALRRRRCER
jgi:NADH-quinone oxidoreductase subunit M